MLGIPTSFIVVLATLMAFVGCSSKNEVARVTAPSGDVDGVVLETNGGASTSFGYEVHVVERGRRATSATRAAQLVGAVRSEGAYGVNLRWASEGYLSIEYLDAKSADVSSPSVSILGRRIVVSLRSGVRDSAAPAGGMLRALSQGR